MDEKQIEAKSRITATARVRHPGGEWHDVDLDCEVTITKVEEPENGDGKHTD